MKKSSLWLYSDKKFDSGIFKDTDFYITKIVERPNERLNIIDSCKLLVNKNKILLTTTDKDRIYMWKKDRCYSVKLPKSRSNFKVSHIRKSPIQAELLEILGEEELNLKVPVSMTVSAFNICREDTKDSVYVTQRRSSNSRKGYLFELCPSDDPILKDLLPLLLQKGYKRFSYIEYLYKFLPEIPEKELYPNNVRLWDELQVKTTYEILRPIFIGFMDKINRALSSHAVGTAPEGLHDLRIAVRTFKSFLISNPPCYPKEAIKAYHKAIEEILIRTSPIRDIDILAKEISGAPNNDLHIAVLVKELERDRQTHVEELIKYYTEAGVQELFAAGKQFINNTAMIVDRNYHKFIVERLEYLYDCLKKTHKKACHKKTTKSIHKLRLAIKNLRYHVEWLHPFEEKQEKAKLLKSLKAMQSSLGKDNDYKVYKKLLKKYQKKLGWGKQTLQYVLTSKNHRSLRPKNIDVKSIYGAL